ncbi:HlyD family efflux transporter periplasmic adaptor subunit [Polaromonas sp.]|nr:HlyD family efflux transporter periplasmic adaptor subunit [Candidatus Saccharibacteria bacterium]
MTFKNRLKFFLGLLTVFLIVGLLVLYLNHALSTVKTNKAALGADTITVGVDYPGLVSKQSVNEGEKVTKGQTIFEVTSPELAKDLANKSVVASALPFSVDPQTSNILVKATDTGVVEKINYLAGSYVPGGAVMATLNTVGSLYVLGHYNLSPPDYARVKKGNSMVVTFPDNTKLQATVYNIALAKDGDGVDTIVKARLPRANVADFRFPIGTPVDASLTLSQRTWYQDLNSFVRKLFKPAAN